MVTKEVLVLSENIGLTGQVRGGKDLILSLEIQKPVVFNFILLNRTYNYIKIEQD